MKMATPDAVITGVQEAPPVRTTRLIVSLIGN